MPITSQVFMKLTISQQYISVTLIVHFTQLFDICEKFGHKFTNAFNYSVVFNAKIFWNHLHYLKTSYTQWQVPTSVKRMEITGMNSFILLCRV
jgi:hypothetical protein